MKKNPFSVLGVPDTASDEEIRNAYRELARKYSDLSDDGKMQEINDAYDQIVMLRGGLGGSSSSSSSRSSSYAGNMSDLSDIREKIRGGRIEDALVLLDGIPEQYRTAEWYYLKGAAQQRRGWLDYASENFDRACSMDPNNREYAAAKENLDASKNGGFRSARRSSSGCSACDVCSGATAVEIGAANLVDPFICKKTVESLPAAADKYNINELKDIIGGAHNG